MNFIMRNITKENHNTYSGDVYAFDFCTDCPRSAQSISWANRIVKDLIFDKQCEKNIETTERRIANA